MHSAAAVQVVPLPVLGADAQTRATLRTMRDVAIRAARSPRVVETAVRIVRGVSGRDFTSMAAEIRQWLEEHIRFIPDPRIDGEVLRTPRYLLEQIDREGQAAGDCDDVATLAAALGKSVGLRARFVVLAFAPGGPFRHVFTELHTPRGWREMDVTEPARQRRAHRPTRGASMEV